MELQAQGIIQEITGKQSIITEKAVRILKIKETPLYKEVLELEKQVKVLEKELKVQEQEVCKQMLTAGIKNLEGVNGQKVSVRVSQGSIKYEDESVIPDRFKKEKVTTSIDNKALKEAFKAGEELHESIYLESKTSLNIKTK